MKNNMGPKPTTSGPKDEIELVAINEKLGDLFLLLKKASGNK